MVLLGSSDPTIFRVNGIEYRLLYLQFVDSGELSSFEHRYHILFFFLSPMNNSRSNCIELTKRMERLTKIKDIMILFHKNTWVIDDYFPIFYPFVRELGYPNYQDYYYATDWMFSVRCPAISLRSANKAADNGGKLWKVVPDLTI
jgi:hypothetical protein